MKKIYFISALTGLFLFFTDFSLEAHGRHRPHTHVSVNVRGNSHHYHNSYYGVKEYRAVQPNYYYSGPVYRAPYDPYYQEYVVVRPTPAPAPVIVQSAPVVVQPIYRQERVIIREQPSFSFGWFFGGR